MRNCLVMLHLCKVVMSSFRDLDSRTSDSAIEISKKMCIK